MSIVTRRFSACPVRTAANTWATIVGIIGAESDDARKVLMAIEGIAASVISDESPKKNPFVIVGSGSRLRVYCLFEEDGSTEDANESALSWNPFAGNWTMFIPAEKSELEWVGKALEAKDSRFKAYEVGTKPVADEEDNKIGEKQSAHLNIDLSKL